MVTNSKRRPRGAPAVRELVEIAKIALPRVSIAIPDLVHVTTVGWGRRIIASGIIERRRCSVFEKELVYFFLARPAYRFGKGDEKNDQLNFFPFAIVLSPDTLPAPYHVYPFDTGAFMAGFYDEVVDPSIYLDDYELDPDFEAASRHLEWAFGDVPEYFDARIKPALANSIPLWRATAQSWVHIAGLSSVGRDRPDRRASAVELAFAQSIDLRQGHGRYLIFPEQLLEDPHGRNTAFFDMINNLKIEYETYDWRPNETPDSYAESIAAVIRRNLRSAAA